MLDRWCGVLLRGGDMSAALSGSLAPELDAFLIDQPQIKTLRSAMPIVAETVAYGAPMRMPCVQFEHVLAEYWRSLGDLEQAQIAVSSITIQDVAPLRLSTTVHYVIVGSTAPRVREERTGAWQMEWTRRGDGLWEIIGWLPAGERRSRLRGEGFVDITQHCLGSNASLSEQLDHGIDYWRTVLDGACAVDIYGNNGIAVGDIDNDGLDEVYVCQPSGLPNRLYRNRGDGIFDDVTERVGVGVLDATSSAIFADFRNSGNQDLIVVRTSGPLLFLNKGDGTFELKPDAFRFAQPAQGSFTAVAVADYNLDGLLDVYFCLYSFYQGLSEYQFPTPYYDAQNGPPNFLFKNLGDGVFVDVTESSGMQASNHRYTLACSWNDYNRDGYPDLYVVNDFGRKVLYRNNHDGTFSDVSAQMGVEDPGEGMSSTWFDYDNDGYDDLYAVNMWEAAGKRVTMQPQFMPGVDEAIRRIYRRDAAGNTLLHAESATGTYRDVTDQTSTRVGGWNWSSGAWDIDHDGYQDLYVANGFISGTNRQDLSSFYWRQVAARSMDSGGHSRSYEEAWSTINEGIRSDYTWSGYQTNNLYLNNGDGSFTESASLLGLGCLEDGRAFALTDLDGDGRYEVLVKNRNSPQLRVLHNQLALTSTSIAIVLRGTTCNRDAVGAVVEIETAQGTQRQMLNAGSGFLSQHTKCLHFGLGDTSGPVDVTVYWPGGAKEEYKSLSPGHRVVLQQGETHIEGRPFLAVPRHSPAMQHSTPDDLDAPCQTWMVSPIAIPTFHLRDLRGRPFDASSIHQPTLLVFWQPDCSASAEYLRLLAQHAAAWKRERLDVLTIVVGDAPASLLSGDVSLVQILLADERTMGVYEIFYRYLYERRRQMPLPTSFLVNAQREVIKVYSGGCAPMQILRDHRAAVTAPADPLARALPFRGTYYGAGYHHNYFTYGVAYLQRDYTDQALASFQKAVEVNPAQAGAYYNIGIIYLGKNLLDEARTSLEKAVELDPTDANAWNNLGVVSGEKGNYAEAQRFFEKTLSVRPTHLLALQNLVKLYIYDDDAGAARRILQQAIAADPSDPQLHLQLAMFAIDQKDSATAQAEFEKILSLQPGNAAALNGLGVLEMRQGQLTKAMQHFQRCHEVDPDFDRAYLNEASMLLGEGQKQQALDLLSGFLDRHPEDQDIADAVKQIEQMQ